MSKTADQRGELGAAGDTGSRLFFGNSINNSLANSEQSYWSRANRRGGSRGRAAVCGPARDGWRLRRCGQRVRATGAGRDGRGAGRDGGVRATGAREGVRRAGRSGTGQRGGGRYVPGSLAGRWVPARDSAVKAPTAAAVPETSNRDQMWRRFSAGAPARPHNA